MYRKGGAIMAQVNIRVDDNVKARAESACLEMGLNMTTAINIFLVKLGNERRIPFEVSANPLMTRKEAEELFLSKMKAAKKEVAEGKYKTSEEVQKILGV